MLARYFATGESSRVGVRSWMYDSATLRSASSTPSDSTTSRWLMVAAEHVLVVLHGGFEIVDGDGDVVDLGEQHGSEPDAAAALERQVTRRGLVATPDADGRRASDRADGHAPGHRRPSIVPLDAGGGRSLCRRPTASCATGGTRSSASSACSTGRPRRRQRACAPGPARATGCTMVSEYVTFQPPTARRACGWCEGPWFFESFSGGWNFTPVEPDERGRPAP